MAHADILHPALHALPDVTIAVEPTALTLLDLNRGEAFGHTREAFLLLGLDAVLDMPRADLERFVMTADGQTTDVGLKLADGSIVHATARASNSAAAATQPCVLLVIREQPEHGRILEEAERLREVLDDAAEALAQIAARRRAKPAPVVELDDATELVEEEEPPWIPELSLAQYASFRIESELNPTTARDVDARYGLPSDASRVELHRVWAEKLKDAALGAQFASLSAQYRDWYLAQQRAREAATSAVAVARATAASGVTAMSPNGMPIPSSAVLSASSSSSAAPSSGSSSAATPAPPSSSPEAESRRQQRITAPSNPAAGEAQAAPLPFAAETAPAPAPAAPSQPQSAPAGPINVRATIGVNDAPGGEALPFKNAAVPDLTVEQFAALGVELEAYPDRHVDVLSMYGITTDSAWRITDSVWTTRFANDPALRTKWMKLSADLRTKLVRK